MDMHVAAVSLPAPLSRISHNISRMDWFAGQARASGARIICFPEASITGYTTGENAEEYAIAIDSEPVRYLKDSARRHGVMILGGLLEKGGQGNVYLTHLAIDPDRHVNIYRKLYTAPPEQKVFARGECIPVFRWCGLTFGIQLCYDAHFPELTTEMALQGVDVVFIPHASPRGTSEQKFQSWMRHLRARAFDNGIYIIACNQCGENGGGLTFPGVVVMIDPSGEVVASDTGGREAMVTAKLSHQVLAGVRNHRMRYFLPNRRPELYSRGDK